MERFNFTWVQGHNMSDLDELRGPISAADGEWIRYEDYKGARDTLLASLEEARHEAEEFRDAYCSLADSTMALPWETCPECHGDKILPGVSPGHTEPCTTCQGEKE